MGQVSNVTLLGLTELLTNVLQHAKVKEARILVQATADSVCVTVSDLDPRLPVLKPADLLSEDGRGLALLQTMADGFGIVRTPLGKDDHAVRDRHDDRLVPYVQRQCPNAQIAEQPSTSAPAPTTGTGRPQERQPQRDRPANPAAR
ncbi:ATP-binding protein [Streptomyces sp. NPDC052236]|uniref:ATP-binding protein n=1 Tax=Streptomyces sp. NPDC052236 TaxID=3365686 RepID=UPI0037D24004